MEIEEKTERARQEIEAQHAQRVTRHLTQHLARVDLSDKILLTEFARISQEEPYTFGYVFIGFRGEIARRANSLAEGYYDSAVRQVLMDDGFRQILWDLDDNRAVPRQTRRDARRFLVFVDRVRRGLESLEGIRDVNLHSLQQRERNAKEEIRRAMIALDRGAEKSQAGSVNAVGSDGQGPFCMVEGVNALLRVGDVIDTPPLNGVKILAIFSGAVRFEKDGATWEQKL